MGPFRGPSSTTEKQQTTLIEGETMRVVNLVEKGVNQQYETRPGDVHAK